MTQGWQIVHQTMRSGENNTLKNIMSKKRGMIDILKDIQKTKHYKELEKRIKSYTWRFGMAFLIGLVGVISGYLESLDSKEVLVVASIYVLNEITRYLNKKAK